MQSYKEVSKMFGGAISIEMKLLKHIEKGEDKRVKDYILYYFDSVDPHSAKEIISSNDHEAMSPIKSGIEFLKKRGWKAGVMTWKTLGDQVVLVSPNDECYHSNYNYSY